MDLSVKMVLSLVFQRKRDAVWSVFAELFVELWTFLNMRSGRRRKLRTVIQAVETSKKLFATSNWANPWKLQFSVFSENKNNRFSSKLPPKIKWLSQFLVHIFILCSQILNHIVIALVLSFMQIFQIEEKYFLLTDWVTDLQMTKVVKFGKYSFTLVQS